MHKTTLFFRDFNGFIDESLSVMEKQGKTSIFSGMQFGKWPNNSGYLMLVCFKNSKKGQEIS